MTRLGGILTTVLGITLVAFFAIRMTPGDPVLLMVGERGADPHLYQQMASKLGLDHSLSEQYLSFIGRAARGDLGASIVSGRPVLSELMTRWPASIELGVVAIVLAILIGIPIGVVAALNRNKFVDYVITAVSLVGYSMPIFWLGLLMILFFSIALGLMPVSGRIDTLYDVEPVTGFMTIDTLMPSVMSNYGLAAFTSALSHICLPAFTMAAVPIGVFARMTRASMLEVLSEDYIRTAMAKGLSGFRVVWVHAFRNALLPIITVGGVFFVGAAVTGAIMTESIFSWPGIGSYIVSSVFTRDYPVIQGGILLIGMLVVAVNAAVDVLYRAANPRLRA